MKKSINMCFIIGLLFVFGLPMNYHIDYICFEKEIIGNPLTNQHDITQSLSNDALAVGSKDIMIINITDSHTITPDGNLSDWIGLPFYEYDPYYYYSFTDMNISLAYDEEYVYVALQWQDSTLSNDSIGYYTKTGMLNSSHATWGFNYGADDLVTIRFYNGTHNDQGVWTASNRTDESHAYEIDDNYDPDEGILPFDLNSVTGRIGYQDDTPIFDNTHTPIADYTSIPIGTNISMYYPQTPTLSQTDYEIGWNWNESMLNGYSMEIKRKLDTNNSDDNILDYSLEGHRLDIGVVNQYNTIDMYCETMRLDIGITNQLANFTFENLLTPVTGDLFLKGVVEDDYDIRNVEIRLSGWNNTFGPNYYIPARIWDNDGKWETLLSYNYNELPLGVQNVTVKITPKYEDPIILWQIIEVQDNLPPAISGVIDINSKYPYGVPASENNITIVVGVYDNYGLINLTVILYYSTNFGTNDEVVMEPFTDFGTTFNAEIPLPDVNVTIEEPVYYNYTFFIMAKDLVNHTTYSANYSFTYPDVPQVAPNDWLKLAYIIPSSVIGAGLIIAIPIIFLRKKGQ